MARYTYGGGMAELVVEPIASLDNALRASSASSTEQPTFYDKAAEDVTRAIVTDFLIDATGDGVLDDAASSITIADDGYLPRFQGPDGVRPLYDEAGHQLDPHNSDEADVPLGDTTLAGIWEGADDTEALSSGNTTRVMSPHAVSLQVDAHDDDVDAHPALSARVDDNTTAINAKADLVTGVVPLDQLPGSTSATADKVALYDTNAQLATATATGDTKAVNLLQMNTAINAAAVLGTDVRHRAVASGSLPITLTTTYAAVPTITVADAVSGQVWRCEFSLKYRGNAADDLKVRFKGNTAAATNKLANPSFETNTTNWASSAAAAIARATTGGGQDGSAYMTITSVTTANAAVTSEWVACLPGSVWTAGAYFKWQTGTPRTSRVDIQFGDAGQVAISGSGTVLGTGIVSGTGAFTQATCAPVGGSTAPSTAAYVRVRIVTLTPAVSDVVRVDAVQLEPTATLPAYGSTGGGGASALDIDGVWTHPATGTTTVTTAPIRTAVRTDNTAAVNAGAIDTSTDETLAGAFLVTVGGTGLTAQLIGLEAGTVSGTSTTIVSANATFARVV